MARILLGRNGKNNQNIGSRKIKGGRKGYTAC